MNEIIEHYNTLVAAHPTAERKGKTTPYTSINGHMYSFVGKEGTVGLRLNAQDRAGFMEIYGVSLMEQHGRIMKEYVEVPLTLMKEAPEEVADYFQKSFDYVSALQPKPSKKK